MPLIAARVNAQQQGLKIIAKPSPKHSPKKRIFEALGAGDGHLPKVNEMMLSRYYQYLSANLLLPFPAYYPEPKSTLEEVLLPCTVFELLAPNKYLGDEFNGIFCRTANGNHELSLPLIELELPQDSPNFQLIEDYWYWFWNWQ